MNFFLTILAMILFLFPGGCGQMQRSPTPGFGFTSRGMKIDEDSMEYKMKVALLIGDHDIRYQEVEELLRQGANPDRMAGQFKWVDTNPLWITCYDENFVSLFVSYGADVKKRPYIAKAMSGRIAVTQEQCNEWDSKGLWYNFEDSVLKSVETLLKNGADPNLKWIGGEKVLIPATNWNYLRYFRKHGELPINNAIEYNAIKLVTLLLNNGAILDEESLMLATETTERTGSSEMEDLVRAQWERQSASAAQKRIPSR